MAEEQAKSISVRRDAGRSTDTKHQRGFRARFARDHIFYPLLHGPFCGHRFFSPTPLALLRPSVRPFVSRHPLYLLACLTGSIISACPKCSSPTCISPMPVGPDILPPFLHQVKKWRWTWLFICKRHVAHSNFYHSLQLTVGNLTFQ
jgi:hypothetical protein